MSIKAKVLTLAMLSMTVQQTYVLSQSYDQGYSNYQQGQGQGYYNNPNQGYYNNPNQGYYNQGQGYNIQLNEQNRNYPGNHEGYHGYNNEYRGSNDTNHNSNRTYNQYNHDQNRRTRNIRAEADDATPHSYPLGDETDSRHSYDRDDNTNRRADDRNTAYRVRGQNNSNRQLISDNTNVTTSTSTRYDLGAQTNEKAKGTVVEVLSSDPSFSTLVQAITAAGLLDTLNGRGPFTIFAPNNDAFKKLPADQLNDLLKPENKQKLAAILKYHIMPGKIMAADLVSAKVISVQGKPLDLKVNGAKATVNNANITNSDLSGTNGVVHIIDTVLIPN